MLVKITPEKLKQLSREVRKVGAVLFALPPSLMTDGVRFLNGHYDGIPQPVKINGEVCQKPFIRIVNHVDAEKHQTTNSGIELDRTRIPVELIFDFLAHHEIAHAKYGHPEVMRHLEKFYPSPVEGVYCCCEIMADRYAWLKIQPGVALPVRKHETANVKAMVKKFDGFMKRHRAIFKSFYPKIVEIPSDALVEMVQG